MTKTEAWIAAQIETCLPEGGRGRPGVDALLQTLAFFDGKRSQVFGMVADRAQLPEAATLRAQAVAALRTWHTALGAEDQLELFVAGTRMGLELGLPEPAAVTEERAFEATRDAALAEFGRPTDHLPVPGLAETLAALRTVGARVPFEALAQHVRLPGLYLDAFEWFEDTWSAVAAEGRDPSFLPLAGADGDALGLLFDPNQTTPGPVPLVYAFHEQDPTYTWVFEDCAAALALLRTLEAGGTPDASACGTEHPAVTALLLEQNGPDAPPPDLDARAVSRRWVWQGPLEEDVARLYADAGNTFAVHNLRAQRLWRDAAAGRTD